jgi:hypothetical protein
VQLDEIAIFGKMAISHYLVGTESQRTLYGPLSLLRDGYFLVGVQGI